MEGPQIRGLESPLGAVAKGGVTIHSGVYTDYSFTQCPDYQEVLKNGFPKESVVNGPKFWKVFSQEQTSQEQDQTIVAL